MSFIIESLQLVLDYLVEIGILLFEFVGVGIIIVSCIYCFTKYIKHD